MLTSDQERALERFSLECSGKTIAVRELKSSSVIFKSERKTLLVEPDGKVTILRGRRARVDIRR